MAGTPFNDAENRVVGVMMGSAAADAIGIYTDQLSKQAATEAYRRSSRIIASHKANELTLHYPDEHRAQYGDGNWSEITEMALCTLFSLVHDRQPELLLTRLRYLSQNGNRAYGLNPLPLGQPISDIVEAEGDLQDPLVPGTAALNRWASQGNREKDYHTGSNAPLIRIHPLAVYTFQELTEGVKPVAAQQNLFLSLHASSTSCRYTHMDPRCTISVMVAAALLRGLIRRDVQTQNQINPIIQKCKRQMDLWADTEKETPGSQMEAFNRLTSESWAEFSRLLTVQSVADLELEKSNGEVWKCLSAGIFCLRTAMARLERLDGQARENMRKTLFGEIINDLVLEGGAAQANAAFAGALLGAYLGYDAIPEHARRGLSHRRFLMRKSKLLCEAAGIIHGDPGRLERDSAMGAGRNEEQRNAMQKTIQHDRAVRLHILKKRWNQRRANRASRRRTVYDSLKFPPKGT